ncbi:MAG: hypothetical protein QOF33_328, partial [Thermomicrobiales bacterium]|nr:hypothetical protein [Thermomicrobiales bacterium]
PEASVAITFRWCCGWWPWWWWRTRFWHLEPLLAERIIPALQREQKLPVPPIPSPRPDLAIFNEMLAEPDRSFAKEGLPVSAMRAEALAKRLASQQRRPVEVDPTALASLGDKLRARLPIIPELERLRLWPWWPWYPWWDCTPDIIFRVTQSCRGDEAVIVDETCWDTRWDIPTSLSVTLVANELACCIPTHGDPEGNCLVISRACDDLLDTIGGNPGAPPAPVGYVNPGQVSYLGDRPYAGDVPIAGLFGNTAGVDYYEFEWSPSNAGPWNPMPPLAAGGFSRGYWGPQLPAGPVGFHAASFPLVNIGGRNVFESREHFEANNGAGSWGASRFWTYNWDRLMVWEPENNFADGTYYLRVRGWTAAGSDLVDDRILPLCDTEQQNGVVLTIDNRLVGPASGHPTGPSHPCGTGTVHACTTEPDTDFIAVRINGALAEACAVADAKSGGTLEIDFLAHDPDGHLSYYSLIATYGENLAVDLLSLASASLSPLTAAQEGPTYGQALVQGATAPIWQGGTFRLTIKDLTEAFPVTCCYQLELRAYKRNIVNCDHGLAFNNLSEYSLTIVV